jgi:hypothetical protein
VFRDAIEDDTDYAVKAIEVQAIPDSTTSQQPTTKHRPEKFPYGYFLT